MNPSQHLEMLAQAYLDVYSRLEAENPNFSDDELRGEYQKEIKRRRQEATEKSSEAA